MVNAMLSTTTTTTKCTAATESEKLQRPHSNFMTKTAAPTATDIANADFMLAAFLHKPK